MRLLWVGDAVAQTGFARVTHNIVGRLKQHGWHTDVLGVNYHGDPHDYPYPIWPAMIGGDAYGLGRLEAMIKQLQPDAVLILNDPWIVRDYLTVIPNGTNVVAYMPVDAPHQRAGMTLGKLSHAIAYTNFGRKELAMGGFDGPCTVIPHGVDTTIYQPQDKFDARARLKFKRSHKPEDVFIVGNINRNQTRKRLDLTVMYWTDWWVSAGQPENAYLYLHCSNRDEGWDVIDLARYFGMETQLIMTNPRMTAVNCVAESDMPYIYSLLDVQLSTTLGEGWGLTNHEGMACGTPQILPRYSALGEWAAGAAHFVDVTSFQVTPKGINTIGGIADQKQTVEAIQKFYEQPSYRTEMGALALTRARQERFKWDTIAEQFHAVLTESVVALQQKSSVGVGAPQ